MKLEVGMYVRTDNGMKFGKVTEIHNVSSKVWYKIDTGVGIDKSQLTKNKIKHRIIDLIEEGDILKINNEKYQVIYDESYEKLGVLIPSRKELSIRHSALEYVFKKYNVSIVTKEQFESMSYKVGDKEC